MALVEPRRRVASPDERVPLDLTYTQIGMILGALAAVQMRINGSQNSLVQRELNDLRQDINEQVQETARRL